MQGLSPPITATPISFANSSHCWWASGVSLGKYQTHCLLVRGGRLIRFISLLEGGFERGKKVLDQFLQCGLPQDDEPDLSGVPSLSFMPLLSPLSSTPLSPIFSALLFLPLCRLGTQAIPFLSAVEAESPSQHVFWLVQPHTAHHWNQRG